jgi:uncharacterized phage-associated protein
MTYPASVIAYAFVRKAIAEGIPVTPMKLQKIVFFAHGYHLARHIDPLIKEKFEAWKFGPVVPAIYQDFKYFGNQKITDIALIFAPSYLDNYVLDASAIDAIEYTWNATKNVSAEALSNWTHLPNSPWSETYKQNELSVPIDDTLIRKYFTKLLAKPVNA